MHRCEIPGHLGDETNVAVEADVCSSCGERYLDPDAIDRIRMARSQRRQGAAR